MTFSHTHCQAPQINRMSQSLSKSVSEPTHGQKIKSTIAQRDQTGNRLEIRYYSYT